MQTPWGASQTEKKLAEGVTEVTTASHGGIHLDHSRNALVHPAWRQTNGWYEEDCEWALVALTFPNLFSPEHVICAHTSAKNWYPDQYERVFKVKLLPDESGTRREQLFLAAHTDDYIATSAFGAGQTYDGRVVPAGMVGVCASPGRRRDRGERWFLVPDVEYSQRGKCGFVIDEQRHDEWVQLVAA